MFKGPMQLSYPVFTHFCAVAILQFALCLCTRELILLPSNVSNILADPQDSGSLDNLFQLHDVFRKIGKEIWISRLFPN